MKIEVKIAQEVHVNPCEIIELLINKEIGAGSIVGKKKGRFYKQYVEEHNIYSTTVTETITEEKYRYVKALELVLQNLKSKK